MGAAQRKAVARATRRELLGVGADCEADAFLRRDDWAGERHEADPDTDADAVEDDDEVGDDETEEAEAVVDDERTADVDEDDEARDDDDDEATAVKLVKG